MPRIQCAARKNAGAECRTGHTWGGENLGSKKAAPSNAPHRGACLEKRGFQRGLNSSHRRGKCEAWGRIGGWVRAGRQGAGVQVKACISDVLPRWHAGNGGWPAR